MEEGEKNAFITPVNRLNSKHKLNKKEHFSKTAQVFKWPTEQQTPFSASGGKLLCCFIQ